MIYDVLLFEKPTALYQFVGQKNFMKLSSKHRRVVTFTVK
jgi:hypothetical protein